MTKTAACACESLKVDVTTDPVAIVACHCIACQRRSGTPFGVGAYYKRDTTRISGDYKTFVRAGDSGHAFRTHFCPTCGTSVFWDTEFKPDEIGVAVGAFADPAFPAPMRSVWERSRHAWINLGLKIPRYLKGRSGGQMPE